AVEEHVDASDRVGKRAHGGAVGDIDRLSLAAFEAVECLSVHVHRDRARPFAYESFCRRAPDALTGAGDDCDLSNESVHAFSLYARGQARGTDRFELFIGEDELLMAERFGPGRLAMHDAQHLLVDLLANFIE